MKKIIISEKQHREILLGGKGDKLSITDIAKKHNISIHNVLAQLKKGISVELEHTTNKKIAREIALDHLSELPDYYDKLEKMESE